MPRIARLVVPGYPHHVTQRGNRRQRTFFDDQDYRLYIDLLAEQLEITGVQVWAYCLMPNHVHLVLIPSAKSSLARLMRETHSCYARRINKAKGWRGHLWQERFHSFVMDETHLLAAARYIELNPVRSGLCETADQWPWSSARAHLHCRPDKILSDSRLRALIPDWESYLGQTGKRKMIKSIHQHSASGRPSGDERFVEALESLTGRNLKPGKPGRPRS